MNEPTVMLRHLTHESRTTLRKLRLFCVACHKLFHPHAVYEDGYRLADESDGEEDKWLLSAADLAWRWCERACSPKGFDDPQTKENTAALLRCVFGGPGRPVAYPFERTPGDATTLIGGWCQDLGRTWHLKGNGWLTPTILSLARAAYEERPGRQCGRCKGRKYISRRVSDDGVGRSTVTEDCPDCHGTGRVEDGTLDPVRLAVLADALEEAGCEGEVYGANRCPNCGDLGFWRAGQEFDHMKKCRRADCGAVWAPGEPSVFQGPTPHPLLAHLRAPGPHVRGCHVLDHLLGKG